MVDLERRTVLAAGAAIATGLVAASATGCSAGNDAKNTVKRADVPVGGGVILPGEKYVVTQPVTGSFAAFKAACTHQGCAVGSVNANGIVCPCHGGTFDLKGQPKSGPVTSPLVSATITESGDELHIAG